MLFINARARIRPRSYMRLELSILLFAVSFALGILIGTWLVGLR